MSKRMSRRALLSMADIVVDDIGVTYFPYPESCTPVYHAEREVGNNGVLLSGYVSGCRYFSEPYANESGNQCYHLVEQFGDFEHEVIEQLVGIDNIDTNNSNYSSFDFVSRDGYSFRVITNDYGKTWDIIR